MELFLGVVSAPFLYAMLRERSIYIVALGKNFYNSSHSSAGQSVGLINLRSTVQARVGAVLKY